MISCPWCKQIVGRDGTWKENVYTCSCVEEGINDSGYSFVVTLDNNIISKFNIWICINKFSYLMYHGDHVQNNWTIQIDNLDDRVIVSENQGKHSPEQAANIIKRYKKLMIFI